MSYGNDCFMEGLHCYSNGNNNTVNNSKSNKRTSDDVVNLVMNYSREKFNFNNTNNSMDFFNFLNSKSPTNITSYSGNGSKIFFNGTTRYDIHGNFSWSDNGVTNDNIMIISFIDTGEVVVNSKTKYYFTGGKTVSFKDGAICKGQGLKPGDDYVVEDLTHQIDIKKPNERKKPIKQRNDDSLPQSKKRNTELGKVPVEPSNCNDPPQELVSIENTTEEDECVICLNSKPEIKFFPCKHKVTCINCSIQLCDQIKNKEYKCPICRSVVAIAASYD
jgi:hypothetical protein